MTWENIELLINIGFAIGSSIGAYKSFRYFKKSKHITIYAQSNKVVGELGEMLELLPDALAAASSVEKRGFNAENAVSETGTKLAKHLNVIMREIPPEYSTEFRGLQKTNCFDLEQYIHSLIDKSAVIEENGRKTLKRGDFDTALEHLRAMQEFLKKKIAEEEEKLK